MGMGYWIYENVEEPFRSVVVAGLIIIMTVSVMLLIRFGDFSDC